MLLLALAACGPTATHSQEDTDTQQAGTPTQTITDDSSAGPGTTDAGTTDPGVTSTSVTPGTSAPGATMDSDATGTSASLDCEALDEQECASEPMCQTQRGDRLDRDEGCLDEGLFAVCIHDGPCLGWNVAYVDPDGTCWMFWEDCLVEGTYGAGWTVDYGFDACPELGPLVGTGSLPPC